MTLVSQTRMRQRLPAAGANGNVLTSDGSGWASQAAPSGLPAVGANGNVLTSNGAAWSSQAPASALPAVGASGNLLTSNGSAWSSQAPAAPYSPGSAGDLLVSNGSTFVASAPATLFNNRSLPHIFELHSDPAVSGWGRALTGTGQVFAVSGTSSTHPGQWTMRIGSGTGSRAAVHLGPATGGLLTPGASTAGFFETMLQFPSINGGGQTFETYIGMADNASSTNVSNGVYFYVNSSNELRARRIVGGLVGTDTLVTTITAGLWYRLRAEYVAGDTVLSWKQTEDRAAALTTAATLANVVQPQGPQIKFARLLGSSTRDLNVDYLSWYLPKV